jgi:hypothetical protein
MRDIAVTPTFVFTLMLPPALTPLVDTEVMTGRVAGVLSAFSRYGGVNI